MASPTDDLRASQPSLMRFLVRAQREYRKPHLWAVVRAACAVWNLALGIFLLSYGFWLGAVPLAASGLLFFTSYRLQQCARQRSPGSLAANGAR